MKLIVGLGNPGPKYQLTRHNVGFLFIDALVETSGASRQYRSEYKAQTQKIQLADQTVMVCKPQTFMNLSGESVQRLMHFYGIAPSDLLVVHDEVDLGFGHLRFQAKRGHGGHNGIRNIHQQLGTNDYARERLGIGRPPPEWTQEIPDYVLSNFTGPEQTRLPDLLNLAIDGARTWVAQGLGQASTHFNGKSIEEN